MSADITYLQGDPDDAIRVSRDEESDGLRAMVCAVIERAVLDAEGSNVRAQMKADHVHRAIGWIRSDEIRSPRGWTFRYCCQLLGLDHVVVRTGIRKRLRKFYGWKASAV